MTPEVREEAERLGMPPEREHLIRIGNELRASGGAGVLARCGAWRPPQALLRAL